MKINTLFRRLLTLLLVALLLAVAGCPRTQDAARSTAATLHPDLVVPPALATPMDPPPAPSAKCFQADHVAPTEAIEPRENPIAADVSAAQVSPPPPLPRTPIVLQAEAVSEAVSAPLAPMAPPPALIRRNIHWQPIAATINRENYKHYSDNPVQLAAENPVSTFSIDVDTGAYTNVQRMLEQGRLPPADAVRTEEFINYFDYAYAPPANREIPFSVTTEVAPAPWNAARQLLLIGIQGYCVPVAEIPPANLVFLIDTSGSMNSPDKLPLVKASLKQLVSQLRREDHVAIVTYAGSSHTALASTPGNEHARIHAAIDQLRPGGSTYGEGGIKAAYAQAAQGFIEGGINRVILATDGDFNVGQVSIEALKDLVAEKRTSGIALTTLGFGQGNYNDAMAVALADIGNGSHHYIDRLSEGRRVLVGEMSSALLTIAKDVKIHSPAERELAALYARLPKAEPEAALDAAILRQAADAVRPAISSRRYAPRWLLGAASAAVLVLAAGIVWRMQAIPATAPVLVPTPAPATRTPAPEARAAQSRDEATRPATRRTRQSATPSAATEAAAQAPPPAPPMPAPARVLAAPTSANPHRVVPPREPARRSSTVRLMPVPPAPAIIASFDEALVPPPSPPTPPPPTATAPNAAAAAQATKPARSVDESPVDAIIVIQAVDFAEQANRPTERVAHIRQLLRDGQRRKAIQATEALHRDHSDFTLPKDLGALLPLAN